MNPNVSALPYEISWFDYFNNNIKTHETIKNPFNIDQIEEYLKFLHNEVENMIGEKITDYKIADIEIWHKSMTSRIKTCQAKINKNIKKLLDEKFLEAKFKTIAKMGDEPSSQRYSLSAIIEGHTADVRYVGQLHDRARNLTGILSGSYGDRR